VIYQLSGEPDPILRLLNAPQNDPHVPVVSPKALGAGFAWVIVELAPDGILVSDDDGEIVMANRQVGNMFGYDRDVLVGGQVESLLPARSRLAHRVHRARYSDAPRTRAMGVGLELLGVHADGTEFPVEISLSAVAADHGPVTVAVIRDLRRQRAREQIAHATTVSDEDERISSALNDQIIHHLFASGLSIAAVLSDHTLDDRVSERLRAVLHELDAAVHDIRTTIFQHLDRTPRTTR
jgi:PAS domain S-box-containing protein